MYKKMADSSVYIFCKVVVGVFVLPTSLPILSALSSHFHGWGSSELQSSRKNRNRLRLSFSQMQMPSKVELELVVVFSLGGGRKGSGFRYMAGLYSCTNAYFFYYILYSTPLIALYCFEKIGPVILFVTFFTIVKIHTLVGKWPFHMIAGK